MFVTGCQQRTSTVPKNHGTKKYRKGDGTGTVEKWYRGNTQRTSTVPKNHGTCGIAVLKSTVKATVLVP